MEGNTAIGVEFDHKGKIHTVLAKREVIICNGATRTPQLLKLSGIGPKEELEKFEVEYYFYSFIICFSLKLNLFHSLSQ